MNKHLASILVTFVSLMCFNLTTQAEDEVTWTDVSTAKAFSDAITANHSAHIRLTDDIDLSSLTADGDYLFDFTFSGKITGAGKKNGSKTSFALLNSTHTIFSALDGAEITDLAIGESSFEGRDTKSGMLADVCSNKTTLDNIIFADISAKGDYTGSDCDHMGCAVGIANDSHFSNLLFMNCALISDGSYLGLVAGEATGCDFTKCIANAACDLWADGNITSYNSAFVGSICGCATSCTLTNCYNYGVVSSDDDRIGGLIGYGNKTNLTRCQNEGVVKHCTKAGFGREVREEMRAKLLVVGSIAGAVSLVSSCALYYGLSEYTAYKTATFSALDRGYLYRLFITAGMVLDPEEIGSLVSTAELYDVSAILVAVYTCLPIVSAAVMAACFADYAVTLAYDVASQPDELGGIAGTVEDNCTIDQCTNMGPVECTDAYCGGIVGYLEGSTIQNCYNRSFVKGGYGDTGGLVGYCKNGTVKNNLCLGPVTSHDTVFGNAPGHILGSRSGTNTVSGNYYLASETVSNNDGTCGFTQEKLPSGWIAKTLNEASGLSIWRQTLGTDFYPTLDDTSKPVVKATTDTYSLVQKIYSAQDFYLAAANPNAQMELQNDIDLKNYYFMLSTRTYPFRGTIDGKGHTLSNCKYESSGSDNNVQADDAGNNAALFPFAINATFRDLTIDDFHITQKDETAGTVTSQALLVGTSSGCHYSNITITNSDILLNADKDYKSDVAGLVAESNEDVITDCTVASSCRFEGYSGNRMFDTCVGGIAALANSTTFTRCYNAATVYADDDNEGGIVALAHNCTIDRCLNTGTITAQSYVGGIAGYVEATTITKCVNTGTIKDDENKKESYRAGIVAYMGMSGSISDCLNFGEVEYPGSHSGAIDGSHGGITYGDGNNYYCQYDGTHFGNISDDLYAQMTSGAYAYSKDWLYQSIDNQAFSTNLPVPIPVAGTVYQNYLCDGSNTLTYSNKYQGTTGHATADFAGLCSVCGREATTIPQQIYIANASELQELAFAVNYKGVDYSNSVIALTQDIDMTGVNNYIPIGMDSDHPFRGYFAGQGHRIKNLTLNQTEDKAGTGVFGCVSGTTCIWDLVVDETCTISSKGGGVAGIVGAVTTPTGATTGSRLSISRCGNEATIYGYNTNAAGLLGAVYGNDDSSIDIEDCYNTGTIYGAKESAALVGWGRKQLTVKRCWNAGTVKGFDTNHALIRYASDATTRNIEDVYQYDELDGDVSATAALSGEFTDGILCNRLNEKGKMTNPMTVWAQNIGTEVTPRLSNSTGIYHERTASSTWGTVVLPYALSSNDDYQLYTVTSCDTESGNLTLKPVDEVTANTPCFFKKLDDSATSVCFSMGSGTFTYTDDDPESIVEPVLTDAGWSMVGSYNALSEVKGVYYLAQDKLWYAEEAITLPAYRAYMTHVDQRRPCKSFSLQVLDEEGDVDEIVNINADSSEGACYNLAGQRVNNSTEGIVIKNGAKYLRK